MMERAAIERAIRALEERIGHLAQRGIPTALEREDREVLLGLVERLAEEEETDGK